MEQPKKVLVVEDDDMLSTVLADEIKEAGFDVLVARDGEEGLEKIFSFKPDAVILDIGMPKKDGLSVLREFHEKEPESRMPIIMLTNSNDLSVIADAVKARAVAYLVKSDEELAKIPNLLKEKLGIS